MSSGTDINLACLRLEEGFVKDALRAIVHTILFHRLLCPVEPSEAECDSFSTADGGVTYCKVGAAELDTTVEEKIDKLYKTLVRGKPGQGLTGAGGKALAPDAVVSEKRSLSVLFFHKGYKPSYFARPDKACWERWTVSVQIVAGDGSVGGSEQRRRQVQHEVEQRLLRIIGSTGDAMQDNHLPPLEKDNPGYTYPFDITVDGPSGWSPFAFVENFAK
eukprot:TRINITY_DN54341_c0_g1_i1.p1 TRINITY_DN54341_c0_g1~~TRINITY_DN54341_c0_g1_i1.p1  ORF type:complete len:236 (+),score=57.55 TRINITY_DN54341_c0_g1_i1:55-708(+)